MAQLYESDWSGAEIWIARENLLGPANRQSWAQKRKYILHCLVRVTKKRVSQTETDSLGIAIRHILLFDILIGAAAKGLQCEASQYST